MGCASSKSTPTVESSVADTSTMLNNGKAIAADMQQQINDKLEDLKDTLSIGSNKDMATSPETERAGEDISTASDIIDTMKDMTTDEMILGEPLTMNLQTENPTDETSSISDKPPTPMPEDDVSLSNVTLCNDSDTESIHSKGNTDTINSNIFNMVCNTAAKIAMEDTDTDDVTSMSLNNTLRSNFSVNVDDFDDYTDAESNAGTLNRKRHHVNESYYNTMDSTCSSDAESIETMGRDRRSIAESYDDTMNERSFHRGRSTTCNSFENVKETNDTYARLGRRLRTEVENHRNTLSMPYASMMKLVQQTKTPARCDCSSHLRTRTIGLNGNMQLNKSQMSLRL